MLTKEFVEKLQGFSPDKHIIVMMAHMDPFYYDSSDTEPNSVLIVIDDEGLIWDVIETNAANEVTKRTEIVAS